MFQRICVVLLLLVSASSSAGLFNRCKGATNEPRPDWVTHGGVISEASFVTGFAIAPLSGENYSDQQQQAVQGARTDLAQKIKVNVGSTSIIAMDNQNIDFTSESIQRTELVLSGIEPAAQWRDKKTCHLYVLVKMPRANADSILRHQLAEDLYLDAQNRALTFRKRHRSVQDALRLSTMVDYGLLPDKAHADLYVHKYQELHSAMEIEQLNFSHALLYRMGEQVDPSFDDDSARELLNLLGTRLPGSFVVDEAHCPEVGACLVTMSKTSASVVSVAEVNVGMRKRSGIWLAELTVTIETWDPTSKLQQRTTGPLLGKVIARNKHQLQWPLAFERLMTQHGGDLDQLAAECSLCDGSL